MVHLSGHAQGTTWQITYYCPDSTVGTYQIDSILDKLDSSMSLYKPYSLICRFNNTDEKLRIDDHFRRVVLQSLDTWRQSGGLFDITVQPLVEAWGFSAKKTGKYPDSQQIKSLLTCLGSRHLRLEGNLLIKDRPCIKIDVDGIAQGYSVDVLAGFLEAHQIKNYIVELGGEIRIKGRRQLSGEMMKVGIEAPSANEFEAASFQRILRIDSGGLTTSGSYRAYHESGGKKFSHIIDPRTGYPTTGELISVTVWAPTALVADAYDNVLMIMGLQAAMAFVEKRKDMAAYFIYRKPDGSTADTATSRFARLLSP